jgi:hypothetical protein
VAMTDFINYPNKYSQNAFIDIMLDVIAITGVIR